VSARFYLSTEFWEDKRDKGSEVAVVGVGGRKFGTVCTDFDVERILIWAMQSILSFIMFERVSYHNITSTMVST